MPKISKKCQKISKTAKNSIEDAKHLHKIGENVIHVSSTFGKFLVNFRFSGQNTHLVTINLYFTVLMQSA